jgi:mannitol/fructose-specific phosphotransferase system IIA component (Ntr-type)
LASAFAGELKATKRREAIVELTELVCRQIALEPVAVQQAVWIREETLPTGIGNGVAVPHARIAGLAQPVVAVGLSQGGIDFEAADFETTHVVFLVLTPMDDDGSQLEIISDIARTFKNNQVWDRLPLVRSYIEFLSVFKTTETQQQV